MIFLGVDVGGTSIKIGAVTPEGKILNKSSFLTLKERPYSEIIKEIADTCVKVAADAGCTMDDVTAIGVGVPGICDPRTGIIPMCTNLGWHQVPFVAEMHKYTDRPVYVDNDATVAGFAEFVGGISKSTHSSVFITLGTGVGGGVIINGRPYSGSHGVGSEIGHMILEMGGEQCTCGNKGCFERYASATAIIREAKKAALANPESAMYAACNGDVENMNAKIVIDAAKAGDPVACRVFDWYADCLAHGIVSIINVLDPEMIVLGGGVSAAGDFLLEAVRKALESLIFFKDMPYARIELATMGNDAGIIGAAMLGKL